jgi:hypothetical protein
MQTKDTGGIRIVPTGSPPPAPCTVTAISFTARDDRPHAACKPDGGASAVTPPRKTLSAADESVHLAVVAYLLDAPSFCS